MISWLPRTGRKGYFKINSRRPANHNVRCAHISILSHTVVFRWMSFMILKWSIRFNDVWRHFHQYVIFIEAVSGERNHGDYRSVGCPRETFPHKIVWGISPFKLWVRLPLGSKLIKICCLLYLVCFFFLWR